MTNEYSLAGASRRGVAGLLVGLGVLAGGLDPAGDALARPAKHHPTEAAKPDPLAEPKSVGARQQERVPFTEAEIATARPEDLPGALRIRGDDTQAFQRLLGQASAAGDPWLVLSGGGENGAYAAGLLNGWTQGGDRPRFGVVTGVSTGALIAPFAFVGPVADAALKANYTEITAADVFELGGNPTAALTDNWPLKDLIAKSVTPDLLRAIAAEHARGRRLLIATTQVDTERSILWDMGAIAALAAGPEADRYGERALMLFREVVLASTAVPGLFPPVMIAARAGDGKAFREMHNDGGSVAPFYLGPAPALFGQVDGTIDGTPSGTGFKLPARTVYVVVNTRLNPEFGVVPRTVLGVLGGSLSTAIKAQTRGAVALAQAFAARTGLDLRITTIDQRFAQTSPAPFDPDYMKALFAHGERLGRDGSAFTAPARASTAEEKPGAQAAQTDGTGAGSRSSGR